MKRREKDIYLFHLHIRVNPCPYLLLIIQRDIQMSCQIQVRRVILQPVIPVRLYDDLELSPGNLGQHGQFIFIDRLFIRIKMHRAVCRQKNLQGLIVKILCRCLRPILLSPHGHKFKYRFFPLFWSGPEIRKLSDDKHTFCPKARNCILPRTSVNGCRVEIVVTVRCIPQPQKLPCPNVFLVPQHILRRALGRADMKHQPGNLLVKYLVDDLPQLILMIRIAVPAVF